MKDFISEQKVMSQLELLKKYQSPSEQVMDSLYAQVLIESLLFRMRKQQLQQKIDDALDKLDKPGFNLLVKQYNNLLTEYKEGKAIEIQGMSFILNLA